jgi:hypothetical protein
VEVLRHSQRGVEVGVHRLLVADAAQELLDIGGERLGVSGRYRDALSVVLRSRTITPSTPFVAEPATDPALLRTLAAGGLPATERFSQGRLG